MNSEKMKPCPFCGGEASVVILDEYGRLMGDSYCFDADPLLGISFVYYHPIHKSPDCIIARDYGDPDGLQLFETKEACINAWNTRSKNE